MPTDKDKHLLATFVESHRDFVESIDRTISSAENLVELVTAGLRGNVPAQMSALEIARRCPLEVRKKLLPVLLQCSPSIGAHAANVILTLPKEWLVNHIETVVDPLLGGADHIDFGFFLQLFARIDLALANRLAHRALGSSDPDVQEMGANILRARTSN